MPLFEAEAETFLAEVKTSRTTRSSVDKLAANHRLPRAEIRRSELIAAHPGGPPIAGGVTPNVTR